MNKINNIKIHGNMNRRFAAVILVGVALTATFSGCKAQKTEDISVLVMEHPLIWMKAL